MGISRSNISRILQQARQRGIVEIAINDPEQSIERDLELERRLEQQFRINTARVARVKTNRNTLDKVGKITAQLLSENLSRSQTIGLSWGKTLQSVVRHLPKLRLAQPTTVYPLVGGLSMMDSPDSGDSLVQVLSEKLGAKSKHLYAPALVGSEESHRVLMNEPSIRNTLSQASKVELGLVGIGAYGMHSSARLIGEMQLNAEEQRQLQEQHPVGDICGRFYDLHGTPLGPPTSKRIIAVEFARLVDIPVLVGVAAGIEKALGVLGALRSEALDVIVVDSLLAEEVLRLHHLPENATAPIVV